MEQSERSVLTGIAVLRIVTWVWMLVALVVQRHDLAAGWHAGLAWGLVGLAGMLTVLIAVMVRSHPDRLLEPPLLLVELALALALMALDGVVFAFGHVDNGQSSLAASWPLAVVLTMGVAYGEIGGLLAGLAVSVARAASVPLNGVPVGSVHSTVIVSALGSLVIYVLAGAVVGYVVRLLGEAGDKLARAQAREEITRTLHDGVLQTLTLVERRSPDADLATLAREQESELRAFLAGYSGYRAEGGEESGALARRLRRHGHRAVGAGQLEERLRRTAARFEKTYTGRVDVVVAPDVPKTSVLKADALVGAVSEALVNAGKHGHAGKVTIFVEPAEYDALFCSVNDDGEGFDPTSVIEGIGLRTSIRGRVKDVGGRVEIDGALGRGAEVRMWV